MPAVPDPAALGQIAIFQGLELADLTRLNGLLRRQTMPTGMPIIAAEAPGDMVYVILNGAVKVHVEQADGTDVILAILGAGEILGEMSVVDSLGRSATAVTMEDTILLWMDRGAFWDCMRTMPGMTYNLAAILTRRLRLADARIQALATQDVYGRVASIVLALAQEYGEPDADGRTVIPFRLTQSDVAGLVGASRVRVNQVLVSYKRRGFLSVNQDYQIMVHNPEALALRCQ